MREIKAWTVQDGNDKGRIGLSVPPTFNEMVIAIPGARHSRPGNGFTIPKAWPAVLALGGLAKDKQITLSRAEELRLWMVQSAKEWARLRELSAALPPKGVKKADDETFYPHQVDDAIWLTAPGEVTGRLLLSETGIGKTMAVVAGMNILRDRGDLNGPVLVSCPESVMNQGWVKTFAENAPQYRVIEIQGSLAKRKKQIQQVKDGEFDVAIIGHSNLKSHTRFEPAPGNALRKCVRCGGPRLTHGKKDAEGNIIPTIDYHHQTRMRQSADDDGPLWIVECAHGTCKYIQMFAGPHTSANLVTAVFATMAHRRSGKEIKELTPVQCQAHMKDLNEVGWSVVVVDECFVPTALVDTPTGPQAIGDLAVGDQVWGYDEIQGTVVATTITAVMSREADVVGGLVTADHPVRVVNDAYRPLSDLRPNDETYWLDHGRAGVPTLRRAVLSESCDASLPWSQVLQSILFGKSNSSTADAGGSRSISAADELAARTTGRTAEIVRSLARRNQSVSGSIGARKGISHTGSTGMGTLDRRERQGHSEAGPGAVVTARTGMGQRAYGIDARLPGATDSTRIQNRSSSAKTQAGSRSGRSFSLVVGRQEARSEERSRAALGRMDGSEIFEPRNPDRSEHVRRANLGDRQQVVNIETGTSNYFVHGLLVHNCHRAMNSKSQLTQAIWGVNTHSPTKTRRWALSGTIISTETEQAWAPLHYADPVAYPVKTKWVDWYCVKEFDYYGYFKVTGLNEKHKDEFHKCFSGITRRVLKSQVLDLPEKLRGGSLERRLVMGGEQLKAYESMRDEMLLMVKEGLITAENVAVQAGRLTMLASGTGYPDPNNVVGGPQKMLLRAPSVKLDEIIEMLKQREFGDSQVGYLFASSTALRMFEQAFYKAGVMEESDVAVISGHVLKRDRDWMMADFQAGKRHHVLLTYAAGGTGVTLNAANQVVVVQRDWSPINNAQGIDRFHRIGSERFEHVVYHDLVVENSNEVAQMARMERNAEKLEELVRDKDRLVEVLGLDPR